MIEKIKKALKGRCPAKVEADLQIWIAGKLAAAGVPFVREHSLDKKSRIDFVVIDGAQRIGIEVKTAASQRTVTQMLRYAQSDQINALVLVSTARQPSCFPAYLNGKDLHYIALAFNNL